MDKVNEPCVQHFVRAVPKGSLDQICVRRTGAHQVNSIIHQVTIDLKYQFSTSAITDHFSLIAIMNLSVSLLFYLKKRLFVQQKVQFSQQFRGHWHPLSENLHPVCSFDAHISFVNHLFHNSRGNYGLYYHE